MPEHEVAPYGTWRSAVRAADLVEGTIGLGYPRVAPFGIVWEESRPSDRGRLALVARSDDGTTHELLPPEMSARTTAHEYGGRAWAVGGPGAGLLVSSNFADQSLWDVTPGRMPRPLTPEGTEARSARFADPTISPDGKWVVAVRELHLGEDVVNALVAVGTEAPAPREPLVLAEGKDFYSSPEFSADGTKIAFLCWDHPNMPWDSTELWQADFFDGKLSGLVAIAGKGTDEAVVQPRWSPSGGLFYISDRTGWWNLYRDGVNVAPMSAEFAGPAWLFGASDYAFTDGGALWATWGTGGGACIGTVADGRAKRVDVAYGFFQHLAPGPAAGGNPSVLAVAASAYKGPAIVRIWADGKVDEVQRSQVRQWPAEETSVGQAFDFPTGAQGTAHGVYYPPLNTAFRAPAGEAPPLVVTSHGGPTAAASRTFDLRVQFWTSRGFALADIDYRGSTGYGREYRKSLEGRWGLADVEDCAAAAKWLGERAMADVARMVIRGGSASGLTVLAALARHRAFVAGCVRYPATQLEDLAKSTHKFESRYLDRLVPRSEYEARSPLSMAPWIEVPVLFLHGLEDKVVLPSQSRLMVAALRDRGVSALLVEVEGEAHGFRRAGTVVRAQEAELAFLAQAIGIEPADDLARARADLEAAGSPGGACWVAAPVGTGG